MITNAKTLLEMAPIKDMIGYKVRDDSGVSHGLAEVGYDIRLAETVEFFPQSGVSYLTTADGKTSVLNGLFVLASAIEEFQMPNSLCGIVHDKSTWARHGLSVFNTVIEPAWNGFLTLELAYKGNKTLTIPAGAGIAQVVFHRLENVAEYSGSYQNQQAGPVESLVKS